MKGTTMTDVTPELVERTETPAMKFAERWVVLFFYLGFQHCTGFSTRECAKDAAEEFADHGPTRIYRIPADDELPLIEAREEMRDAAVEFCDGTTPDARNGVRYADAREAYRRLASEKGEA